MGMQPTILAKHFLVLCAWLHEVWSGCHSNSRQLPSGNLIHISSIATENGPLVDDLPLRIVVFHSHVGFSEGINSCWVKQPHLATWPLARRWLMRCRRSARCRVRIFKECRQFTMADCLQWVAAYNEWLPTMSVCHYQDFQKSWLSQFLPLKFGICSSKK